MTASNPSSTWSHTHPHTSHDDSRTSYMKVPPATTPATRHQLPGYRCAHHCSSSTSYTPPHRTAPGYCRCHTSNNNTYVKVKLPRQLAATPAAIPARRGHTNTRFTHAPALTGSSLGMITVMRSCRNFGVCQIMFPCCRLLIVCSIEPFRCCWLSRRVLRHQHCT